MTNHQFVYRSLAIQRLVQSTLEVVALYPNLGAVEVCTDFRELWMKDKDYAMLNLDCPELMDEHLYASTIFDGRYVKVIGKEAFDTLVHDNVMPVAAVTLILDELDISLVDTLTLVDYHRARALVSVRLWLLLCSIPAAFIFYDKPVNAFYESTLATWRDYISHQSEQAGLTTDSLSKDMQSFTSIAGQVRPSRMQDCWNRKLRMFV